jgi:hypothetical protein
VTSIQRERAQMGKPHVSGFLITAPYIRSVHRLLAFSTFEDDLVVLSPPPFASTEDGDRRLERLGRVAGRWGGRHELRRAVASMVRACGSGRTWRRGYSATGREQPDGGAAATGLQYGLTETCMECLTHAWSIKRR